MDKIPISFYIQKGFFMIMKKIGFFGLLIFWLLCLSMTVNAAMLSPAISVMQEDFEMVKTGVGLNSVSFDEEDFISVLGESDFTGITVTGLPDKTDGMLKLGIKDIEEGQIIEREMLAALRFVPAEEGKTAVFDFLPYGTNYEKPFVCTVYMLDTLNFAPVAEASVLKAKESIPVYSSLTAKDPDGDEITYHLVSEPQKGTLKLSENGEFSYTADANGKGSDHFSYYAADRYGNHSDIMTVSITTTENQSGIIYTDLAEHDCALSAVSLAENGVFVGEKLGDEWYFHPEKTVTRADFLMMAMRMCHIDTALLASDDSGFADKNIFTDTQNRYISAAARQGLVVGLDTEEGRCFCPNDPITSEQASTLLGRFAKYKELSFGDIVAASIDTEGTISDDGFAMLASVGLVANEERKAQITRADAARLIYTLTEKE